MMRYGSSESWSDVMAARTATSPGAIRKKCKKVEVSTVSDKN